MDIKEIEKEVEPIINKLNVDGIPFDSGICRANVKEHKQAADVIHKNAVSNLGSYFDISKTADVRQALESEGLVVNGSLNKHILMGLVARDSDVAGKTIEWRQLNRVVSNGNTLLNFAKYNDRLYPDWNQNHTNTGRIMSKDPCISNMSVPHREAVRVKNGVLIYWDFKNFELRIQASLAQDELMMDIFNEDGDLHKYMAGLLLNKDVTEVTKGERKKFKRISLGYWYGLGAGTIAEQLDLDKFVVQEILRKVDRRFSILVNYKQLRMNQAVHDLYIETPWGRRLDSVNIPGYKLWAWVAQATAADYFKLVLARIAKGMPEAELIVSLFDGAIYFIKNAASVKTERMKGIIESPVEGFCKMSADIGGGESWADAHKMSKI